MSVPEETSEIFVWKVHPAREHKFRALGGIVVMLAMSILAGILIQNWWWTPGALGIQVLFLNRFFFPGRFRIDAEGISARYLLSRRRMAWQDMKRFLHGDEGGFLSTRIRHSPMDGMRGMHIQFGDKRDILVSMIQSRLEGIPS